jgi:hypothetical protein
MSKSEPKSKYAMMSVMKEIKRFSRYKLFKINEVLEAKAEEILKLPPEPKSEWGVTSDTQEPVMMSSFDKEWERWYHNYPLRGRIVEKLFKFSHHVIYRLTYDLDRGLEIPWSLRKPFIHYNLSRARAITFGNHTVPIKGYCTWLDGYLNFKGDGGGMTLDLITESTVTEQIRDAWKKEDDVALSEGYGNLGSVTIVVPGDTITPELLEEGVKKWYIKRFKWHQGHWTHKEEVLPQFIFDVEWDEFKGEENWTDEERQNALKFSRFSQPVKNIGKGKDDAPDKEVI